MASAQPAEPDAGVLFSVIIPAYNEEALLGQTLTAVRTAMDSIEQPGELIVVDNNSTDRTAALAQEYGACVIFEPKNQISRAKNAGAEGAHGQYFIFLDADSVLAADTLRQALHNLAQGDCCGGGAAFALDDPSHRFANMMVDRFNHVAIERQFAAGCFIYCLREAFEGVGGFDERLYASTDMSFSRSLKKWATQHGLAFHVIAHPPVITSSRKLAHPLHYTLSMVLHTLFPFAVYFRSLCWYWYQRPAERSAEQHLGRR